MLAARYMNTAAGINASCSNRVAFRRPGVVVVAFVQKARSGNTGKGRQAPSKKKSTFTITPKQSSYAFVTPAGAKQLTIAKHNSDLALPIGAVFKAQASLWQDPSGRLFLKASAVDTWPNSSSLSDRTYAYIDGVEVRPYVAYLLGSGSEVAFDVHVPKNHRVVHGEHKHQQHLVKFAVDFEEPEVMGDIDAMMVNFGKASIWEEWVPCESELGRLAVSRESQSWANID